MYLYYSLYQLRILIIFSNITWTSLYITCFWFSGIPGTKDASKSCKLNHFSGSCLNTFTTGLGASTPFPECAPFTINWNLSNKLGLKSVNNIIDTIDHVNFYINTTWTALCITRSSPDGTSGTWYSSIRCVSFDFTHTLSSTSATSFCAFSPCLPIFPTTIDLQ